MFIFRWQRPLALFKLLLLALLLGAQLWLGSFALSDDHHRHAVLRQVAPRGELSADEQATIELFRRASPAVVYITTRERRLDLWTRDVFEVPRGTGSGLIWDERGHIVTNYHVIEGASSAQVALSDQSSHTASLVGVSRAHDLAVLKINAPKHTLYSVPVGTVDDLQVGQKVFAIGNPFGLDHTLTTGIVSALNRTIEGPGGLPIEHVVQTDAAINPGNSGGPLLDSAGRLIGINTAIYSPSGAYAGIGFAVPVDTVNRVVSRVIAYGRYLRPELGIVADDSISRALSRQTGTEGLLVLTVKRNSAAAAAGLRGTVRARDGRIIPGDIIVSIDGRPVRTIDELFSAMDGYAPGDVVALKALRDGDEQTFMVTLKQLAPRDTRR